MKLLSQDAERLVFHLDKREVELLRDMVEIGLTARRGPRRLSLRPENLPPEAQLDFSTTMEQADTQERTFLDRIFRDDGGYLRAPAKGAKGYGLIIARTEMELFLQAVNALKLAHWEKMGCPEEGAYAAESSPETLPSMIVIDLVNQLQLLLLRALTSED